MTPTLGDVASRDPRLTPPSAHELPSDAQRLEVPVVSSPAHAAPVRPSQLESVVRLTREGTRSVRLHELARSMGRARNHAAHELGIIHEQDLGRMLASPRTLLVEGTTDQAVLEQVLHRSGDQLTLVQPAGSKTRLAVLHHLHLALRIPHHVLFDGDGGPVSGSSTARHRILRSRREATEALVAALRSSSAAAPGSTGATESTAATDPRWHGEDPAVTGWGFGGPTVVGPSWSALEVDLEDELSRWPSFVSALQARGGTLAAKRPERFAEAAEAAWMEDLPSSFRRICAAVATLEQDFPPQPGIPSSERGASPQDA